MYIILVSLLWNLHIFKMLICFYSWYLTCRSIFILRLCFHFIFDWSVLDGMLVSENLLVFCLCISHTVWNVSKYGVFSGLYFPAFGQNTERYEASLRIQSACGKTRTRKNSVFGQFSGSVSGFRCRIFLLKKQ